MAGLPLHFSLYGWCQGVGVSLRWFGVEKGREAWVGTSGRGVLRLAALAQDDRDLALLASLRMTEICALLAR